MDKIPSEILATIFDYLHYSQKLQCKLVCRKWAYVLQSGSDIESVAIPFKWDYLTKSCVSLPLIEKVRDGLLNGENCRRLILYDYPDRALLAKLFPNLKLVFFQKGHPSKESPEFTPTQIGYLQNWHKSLETFMDACYDAIALGILDSGLFQKLSTIILTNNIDHPVEMITLADKLKNAPHLKSIYLKWFDVDTTNLKKLHSNVPRLESLVLNQCNVMSHEEQSTPIQPAESVKELALVECNYPFEFSPALSRYITCTYSSLERFSLIIEYRNDDILEQVDAREGDEERPIHYTIRKLMHNLRALKSDLIYTSSNTIMKLVTSAPFLEVLSADIGDEENLLKSIIESDTLINTLRSLSLSYMRPLNFELFNRFRHLKHLSLRFNCMEAVDSSFDLNSIINSLPESLDSLKLNGITLDLNPTHANDKNFSHIRSLAIEDLTLKSDLSEYLSRRFPKLKSLAISNCKTKFHFELPSHRLDFVRIYMWEDPVFIFDVEGVGEDATKRDPKYFKLTTSGDGSTFYKPEAMAHFSIEKYVDGDFFDKRDSLQYNICKPFTNYYDERKLRYFHFRCASVQTLLLNEQLIL